MFNSDMRYLKGMDKVQTCASDQKTHQSLILPTCIRAFYLSLNGVLVTSRLYDCDVRDFIFNSADIGLHQTYNSDFQLNDMILTVTVYSRNFRCNYIGLHICT